MPLEQVRNQGFRLHGKMPVKETGPVFLTPLACPSATPWYDLQSHPVSLRPALITPNISLGKTFLKPYKKEEVHLA